MTTIATELMDRVTKRDWQAKRLEKGRASLPLTNNSSKHGRCGG